MNHRILTISERRRIRAFVENGRGNGEKDTSVRQLAFLAKRHLQTIREDSELLEKLLAAYEKEKKGKS
jgi:hypothetical protein